MTARASPTSTSAPRPGPAAPGAALAFVWLASAGVIAACLLTSFRLGFAADLPTLLRVNGPRVLLACGVGAALALAGGLRLAAGIERPLRELELLALSAGGAGGGLALASIAGTAPLVAFAAGALLGAGLAFALVRLLDRPSRWSNLAVAAVLVALAGIAGLAGSNGRTRLDLLAPAVAWLLGDFSRASVASGLTVALLAAALLVAATRTASAAPSVALLAFGLGVGAAGPLAFVGAMPARTVRWLAGGARAPDGASARALLLASAAAGAATVVAIDAVPRLLVGGYDFRFNLPAAMLAIPIFLGWNRARLRRELGRAHLAFEILELALITVLTLAAAALALFLTAVVRGAT